MQKVIISGLLAGVGILAVSVASMFIVGSILPDVAKQYLNPNLFRPWSDPLMQLYFVYPFVLGLALALFWEKTKSVFKGKGITRALNFGYWYFLLATIPGMWITYSSFQVSLELVTVWTVGGFVEIVAAVLILDKLNG